MLCPTEPPAQEHQRDPPGRGLRVVAPSDGPQAHAKDEERRREEVLAQYERRIRALLYDAPGRYPAFYLWLSREDLKADLAALCGKTLACWCAPKDEPLTIDDPVVCHGQTLLKLAEELAGDE